MARVTFLNDNSAGNLREIGEAALKSTLDDFKYYRLYHEVRDDNDFWELCKDEDDLDDAEWAIDKYRSLSLWHEYGLDLSVCLMSANDSDEYYDDNDPEDSIDEEESYVRFQMSYGGPSDEIRLYPDGTIVYVYLDWFCGIGFNITDEEEVDWLMGYWDVETMITNKIEEERGY